MSESLHRPGARAPDNRAESPGSARAVRFVHRLAAVPSTCPRPPARTRAGVVGAALALAAAGAGACVVPPDLTSTGDDTAALNSPPIIVSVADRSGNPFTRPGPRSVTSGDDRLAVTVADNDLADVLTLYFFVDYGLPDPTPRRVECVAPPSANDDPQRTVLCEINTVCLEGEAQRNPHVLEIEVFDRPPVDNGDPPFRSVAPPGLSTGWWWQINCIEGSS